MGTVHVRIDVTVTGKGVGARVTSGDAEFEKLVVENMATISSYGDNFMQVVCRDACDGHDVGRVSSYKWFVAAFEIVTAFCKHVVLNG